MVKTLQNSGSSGNNGGGGGNGNGGGGGGGVSANNAVIGGNLSVTGSAGTYAELSVLTPNNLAELGVDPVGNAYLTTLARPLTVQGPGQTSSVVLSAGAVGIRGNLTVANAAVDSLVVGNLVTTGGAALSYASANVLDLQASTATLDTASCQGLSAANAVADALVANSLTVLGNALLAGGAATANALRVGAVNTHFWLLNGLADNAALGAGNTNALVASWQGLGFADASANLVAPPVNAVLNCRTGSFASKSFLCSTAGANSAGYTQTAQGNGAYLSYSINSGGGATVLTNRRATAGGGGWRFVAQDPAGAVENAPTAVAGIDQNGNLACANLSTGTASCASLAATAGNLTATAAGAFVNAGALAVGTAATNPHFRLLNGSADNTLLGAGNTNALVCSWQGLGFADARTTPPPVNAVINCRDGAFASKSWLCCTGGSGDAVGNLASYQGNGAYVAYNATSGATSFVTRRNAAGAAGGWRFLSQDPSGAAENAGAAAASIDRNGNLACASAALVGALTCASATATGNLAGAGAVVSGALTCGSASVVGNLACASATATGNLQASGALNAQQARVGLVNAHFWLLNGATDNAALGAGNTNALVASWQGLGFADASANLVAPPVNAVVNCRTGAFASKSFLCSTAGANATAYLSTVQGNGAYVSYAPNAFGGSTAFVNRRNGTAGAGSWRFVAQDPTGNVETASGGVASIDHAGNLAAVGTATLGNLVVSSAAGRVVLTANATSGGTGVQFTSASYAGPLAERRTSGTARAGVGVGASNDEVRVYAGTASAAAKVSAGFATSDTTYYDVLTVARDGTTLTGNVGVNTSAPAYPLHVVGDAYVQGAVTASGDVTAFSDRRLKADLRVVGGALGKVSALRGYTFDRLDLPGRRYAGLVAQDVRDVLPEAVHLAADGDTLGVSYAGVTAMLVEAVKELGARVAALEALPRRTS